MRDRLHASDRTLSVLTVLGLVAVVLGLFAQSYNGRQAVVITERQQCFAAQVSTVVPVLNVIREDEADDTALASDPHLPPSARAVWRRKAQAEAAALYHLDLAVDPRAAGGLNATGTAIIRRLQQQGRAFSCTKAFTDAPFIVLLHIGYYLDSPHVYSR